MKCEDYQSLLIDHAYDELSAPARAEVGQHLAGCPNCALEYCRLRADLDGINLTAREAPPPALRLRLRAEVERSFRPPWWRGAWGLASRPVPAYALLVAVLVPALAWLAIDARRLAPGNSRSTPALAPLHIGDYDATTPLLPQRPIL